MSETPPPVVPLPTAGPCRRPSIAPYCERVRARLSPERFAHVLRVAELAETIALANGFDAGELRATCLAAVLHDVGWLRGRTRHHKTSMEMILDRTL